MSRHRVGQSINLNLLTYEKKSSSYDYYAYGNGNADECQPAHPYLKRLP